jgi:hypothetical protein
MALARRLGQTWPQALISQDMVTSKRIMAVTVVTALNLRRLTRNISPLPRQLRSFNRSFCDRKRSRDRESIWCRSWEHISYDRINRDSISHGKSYLGCMAKVTRGVAKDLSRALTRVKYLRTMSPGPFALGTILLSLLLLFSCLSFRASRPFTNICKFFHHCALQERLSVVRFAHSYM